jgi:arylsulfatase A-like enzyme
LNGWRPGSPALFPRADEEYRRARATCQQGGSAIRDETQSLADGFLAAQEALDADDPVLSERRYREVAERWLGQQHLADGDERFAGIGAAAMLGNFHGEHRIAQGKNLAYEPAIRVPLILRGPGVPAGLRLSQRVANIDLAPTILDAADALAGRTMDGRSLLPLVANPAMSSSRDLLIERGPGDGQYVALRTPNFLYVEHATGERELYDLRNDPYELHSRHADPAYAAARDDLARRLAHRRSCSGTSCRTPP